MPAGRVATAKSGINFFIIGYPPSSCYLQNWNYIYQCCPCPAGYKVLYGLTGSQPGCDRSALCVGCDGTDEKLAGDQTSGYSCTTTISSTLTPTPSLCSSITTYTNPKLKGHQVVASPDFVKDIEHLILCLPPGPRSAISVQSTSRCGPSPKDGTTPLPADKISMHQLGYAVDINVILPNGDYCNGECMEKAYCAYHPLSVANCSQPKYMNQPQNERNTIINEFLE
ncbi:hypothetical protein LTR50_007136 [Elasticomyces elasticus]|nr:hypothetical protein LTR50_007136 [Elasticomyces elasticus]